MGLAEQLKSNKERIITGLALLLVAVVVGLIDSFFIMWVVLGIGYMLSFYEASRLFGLENNSLYAYAAILWFIAALYPYADDLFFVSAVIFAALIAYTPTMPTKYFLPFIYPSIGFLFLLTLYVEHGIMAYLWLVVVVAGADIGAYIVGMSIGKRLFSQTSPKKTLEGVYGGIAIATAVGVFAGVNIVDWDKALLISLSVAIAAIFGDLFESYLKRKAGVKDSGDVLPGHGGVLDRLDGYLFAVIIMVVLLRGLV